MLPLSHSRDTISVEIKSTLYLQPVDSQMNIKTPSKFAKLRATWVVGSKNRKEKARKMSVYSTLIDLLPFVWLISSSMDSDTGCTNINRKNEVGHGMKENNVGDEQSQQAKWRR